MKNALLLLLAAASACSHHVPGHVEEVNAVALPVQAVPVNLQPLPSQGGYVIKVEGGSGNASPGYAYAVPLVPVYGKANLIHSNNDNNNDHVSSSEVKNEDSKIPANEKNTKKSEATTVPVTATDNAEQKPVQREDNPRPERSYGFYVPNGGVYEQHGVRIVVPEVTDSYVNHYPLAVAEYPLSIQKGLLTLLLRSARSVE